MGVIDRFDAAVAAVVVAAAVVELELVLELGLEFELEKIETLCDIATVAIVSLNCFGERY